MKLARESHWDAACPTRAGRAGATLLRIPPILPFDPDQELVLRARAGDLSAFEELVERHRDVVFRVAARVVGRDEAHDVSQDAFLRAFTRLDRFRGEGAFRAWLLQITHNAALRAVTTRKPQPVDPQDA